MSKVLLVGLGEVGTHILEFLVRDPKCPELIIGDFNAEVSEKRINNALMGAAILRLYPTVTFEKVDLSNEDETAEIIAKHNPDVVINSAVMQTWHVIRKLPEEHYQRLSSATLGAWLPCQLALSYKLMSAIKKSGTNPHVINTALSDLTNPVLSRVGLAPTIGIGNVDLIESSIRVNVSRKLNISMDLVKVYLVAHHVWWVYPREAGYKKGPYYLKVVVNDKDITNQFDTDKLMYESIKLYPPGTEFTTVSATSTIKNMYALLSPTPMFTHSPTPNGLPGGYPILLSNKGAELALPEGITEDEAVEINLESSRLDGIQSFEPDGSVIYTDYANEILSDMIGFDRKSFRPEESYDLALEMMSKYKAFAAKFEKLSV